MISVFQRRRLLAGLLAVFGVPLIACSGAPVIPIIGLADRRDDSFLVQVAREALESGNETAPPPIHIVGRPGSGVFSHQDTHLAWADSLASLPGLVGVVGHNSSTISLLAAPIYNEAGVVQIVATATNTGLGDVGPWTFQLAPTDSVEGAFIGTFIERYLQGEAVTVYFVADTYGRGLRDGVVAALEQRGLRVLAAVPFGMDQPCPPTADHNPYAGILETSLKHGVPDVAVVVGWAGETLCIARGLHALVPGVRIVAGDGLTGDEPFRAALGPLANSFYVVELWHPAASMPASGAFHDRFHDAAGRAPAPAEALEYDAIMVLAAAVRAVGPDPDAVREYLANLGRSRHAHRGVTGEIVFRDRQDFNLTMVRLGDGTVVAPRSHD